MSSLTSLLLALPASVILLVAFLLPAAEASTFLGVIVPGETAVLVAGVLAQSGRLPLWAVIVAATLGAVLGDQIGFFVGRRHGQPLLDRLPPWIIRHARPERVLDLVRRRGAVAVVLGRWTASLRALMPGVAGASGLSPRRFLIANSAGGAFWAATVAVLGYLAGASFRQAESQLRLGGGVLLAGAVLLVVLVFACRRLIRRRRTRSEAERSPA
jgi:membrane-associated protein